LEALGGLQGVERNTVKDKFSIPITEELIDELARSTIYTKLDLRSGYHEVRMYEDNVFKMAFKTHLVHFEFLVMPLGLINAPATFQSLMNHAFKKYLRKFILVSFNDILIYSPTWDSHIDHLHRVLQTMRDNTLYANHSKCFFGLHKLEYLGHYISGRGVETNPKKLDILQQWPQPKTQRDLL